MKGSVFIIIPVLFVILSDADVQNRNVERHHSETRRFKDIVREAKKTAMTNYLGVATGNKKRTFFKHARPKNFMDILEEFEVRKYARALQNMLKRCDHWSCIEFKAQNTTTSAPVTPPQTPPAEQAESETVTKKIPWSSGGWRGGGWWWKR